MTVQRSLGRLALLALLLPSGALGADLTFGFDTYVDYDSNVFRRENNVEDDVLFRLRPSVKLHEDRGQDFNYSLQYTAPLEFAVENGDRLNDVDHWVDADGLYHVNDRLDVYLRNDFRYLRSTLRTFQTLDSDGLPVVSTGRDRVTLNSLNVGGSYRFTPRVSGNVAFNHRLFESTQPDRADNFSVNGIADVSYTLTSKQQVGVGLTYIYQQFDETISRVGSRNNTINAFAQWRYQVGETIGIEISGGPSYIVVEQDEPLSITVNTVPLAAPPAGVTPPPGQVLVFNFPGCTTALPGGAQAFDPGRAGCTSLLAAQTDVEAAGTTQLTSVGTLGDSRSTSVDFFANVLLTKRWTPNFVTSARYSRTQGVASGLGGTVIRDAVTLAADWNFADRWDLLLRGDWTLRNSVTEANEIVRGAIDAGAPLSGVVAFDGRQFSAPLPDNSIDTERWGVVGRLTYRLFRNTTALGQVTYNDQTSKTSTLGAGSDFQGWIATIGFRHTFEPIKLW
jgi:hypothetical protein